MNNLEEKGIEHQEELWVYWSTTTWEVTTGEELTLATMLVVNSVLASVSTRFRDALLKAAAHLTLSELPHLAALLVCLDPLEFTLQPPILSLPFAV